MKTSVVGQGLNITQFSLGTAQFGGLYKEINEETTLQIVQTALDCGINYFDTAPHYGNGVSETRLGKALAAVPDHQAVVSTKVGRVLLPLAAGEEQGASIFKNIDPNLKGLFDFSKTGIEKSFRESLERLNLKSVDIVYLHDPDDYFVQAKEIAYPVLEKLRNEGVIKAIGVGMNSTAIPTRFINETDIELVLIAGRITLLDHVNSAQMISTAEKRGVSIIAGGVFNSGILANPNPNNYFNYQPVDKQNLAKALKLKAFFEGLGIELRSAALQFPLRFKPVKSVLVGCSTASELKSNIAEFNKVIDDEVWEKFDSYIASPEYLS